MSKWIAEFELEDGDTMPEHMDLEYKGAKIDFHCRPMWIPCSERLPEAECGESESVLVCFENGTQNVIYFNGGNWCYPTGETYISKNYKNGWHNEVVAWMPLPEPYKKAIKFTLTLS